MAVILDASSITAFRYGDHEVFRQIFNIYRPKLYIFCRRHLEKEDAEDIVAETFATLWERREKMDSVLHIERSLYTVAHNKCINLGRRLTIKRGIFVPSDGNDPDSPDEIVHNNNTTDQDILLSEIQYDIMIRQLHHEMEMLPPECHTAFSLHQLEKKTAMEIASIMNIDIRKVNNLCAKAKRLIRDALLKRGVIDTLLPITYLIYSINIWPFS